MRFKQVIFYFLFGLLFLPLIQANFNVVELKPLLGGFIFTAKPDSIASKWFTDEYQQEYTKYYNDSLGFKNLFIRFNNQIEYGLFNKTAVTETIIGKNGYLFELNYINEFYGTNFIGDKETKQKVDEIQKIQNILKAKNILLLPVLASGKGSYFSEFLPDRYKQPIAKTNYSELVDNFKKKKIQYIDLRKKFLEIKPIEKHPIYPNTGIHWTQYGAILALEEIIKTIEQEKQIKFLDFDYSEFEYPDTLRHSDNDIGQAMNLLLPINYEKVAYPIVKCDTLNHHDKLNILMIGDSYCVNMLETGIFKSACNNYELWYYNNTIRPYREGRTEISKFNNYKDEIEKFDVVLLLHTEGTYNRFGFGFYDAYMEADKKEITTVIERIKNNTEWFENVKLQAEDRKITVDSMLVRSALHLIKNRKNS